MRSLLPEPFLAMQKEVNRIFEHFGRAPFGRLHADEISPRIDVAETDGGVEVTAELPGVDEKDVEVLLHDDLLTIKGEKKSEHEEKRKDYHLVERSFGSFSRTIRLPFDPGSNAVDASFLTGVLKVVIKKPADAGAQTAKIPVRNS